VLAVTTETADGCGTKITKATKITKKANWPFVTFVIFVALVSLPSARLSACRSSFCRIPEEWMPP